LRQGVLTKSIYARVISSGFKWFFHQFNSFDRDLATGLPTDSQREGKGMFGRGME
jgi:hypothetical protein